MRFATAYYLMLIYIAVMFKPLIPVLNDAYAHAFAQAIHEATVHARYGDNHLQKDLAAGADAENSKNQKACNPEDQYPVHVTTNTSDNQLHVERISSNYVLYRSSLIPPVFLSTIAPPPKFFLI